MHSLGPRFLDRRDQGILVQIAFRRRGGADVLGFIGQRHMPCVPVGIGKHGDRRDTQTLRRCHDAAGDFSPVGDEDFFEHHILNTPKRVGSMGALRAAESDRARTLRVLVGVMMPSSHRRAVA